MKPPGMLRHAATLLAGVCLAACAHDTTDRVTGECKVAVIGKCSSRQAGTPLSDADKAALPALQNRRIGQGAREALSAADASLKANGFEQVVVDQAGALVQGEKNQKLAERSSQILRAVLNAKAPILPGRPDHETTRALITVHDDGGATAIHAEFVRTVWDSKGDAKTRIVTDPDVYNGFFAKLADNLHR